MQRQLVVNQNLEYFNFRKRAAAHFAKRSEVPVLALHQELSCDIPRWFDFAGLFVLLMELFHTLLGGHQLGELRDVSSAKNKVDD